MKKLLLSVVAAFCITASPAQSYEALLAPVDSCSVRADRAMEAKKYAEAEREYRKMFRLCDRLPDSIQTRLNLAYVYYDMACAQSRLNKRKAAVATLATCVEQGYIEQGYGNYSWMIEDPDLDNIRSEKGYAEIVEKAREQGDFMWILRQAGPYDSSAPTDSLPRFRYADPNDRDLVRVREYFNLDSIAGSGDELSKIRNLMHWVHNVVRHDGSSRNPTSRNAIDLIEVCRKENRGINCRMMAQVLNECYLAMGFKSRFVTCMPRKMVNDCHVINVVYSATLDKWVWVDPTFDAYVVDENGVMLSIQEVRERMRDGRPYFLNEDANWNNESPQTQKHYLDTYMAKNLYYLVCSDRSEFDTETWYEGKHPVYYVALVPEGYDCDREYHFMTTNDDWFWASPYAE
ncbi:transglutaminase domain-containing protein [Alistipes putredinis]|uniref:transglutaminase domain-containing protein n=1 Tax=Alistipes putredinis TaxID=28117 RepID=UPI003AB31933